MKNNGKPVYIVLHLLFIAILVISARSYNPVNAIPEYTSVLPTDLKNFCNVCHVRNSGGPLNSFGDDFMRYEFDRLMEMDSDSDGFTNGEELEAGKHPGDDKSRPGLGNKNTGLLIGGSAIAGLGSAIVYLVFIKKNK